MTPHDPTSPAAQVAGEVFRAALAAADPAAATRTALERTLDVRPAVRARWHWIIATGKAAPAMARAAVEFLAEHGLQFAGGVVVAERAVDPPHPHLRMFVGDHPLPGAASRAAAAAIARLRDEVAPGDRVIALVSGGTSALIGAPIDEVREQDLFALNALLLDSGLPIRATNAIRKRFSRWGAGRLALAFAPTVIHPVILSDVVGDDPVDIASGPFSADPLRAADVEQILRETELARHLPLSMASYLGAVRHGDRAETAKPGSPALAHVREPVVIGRADVLEGAAARARALGRTTLIAQVPLTGEAADAGMVLARAAWGAEPGSCLIAAGETVVELPRDHGTGGRSQQLALAAAIELHSLGEREPSTTSGPRVTLLAAGTDGRDGPTDAAGAIVDDATYPRMRAEGLNPEEQLRRCDAYPALDRIDALLRTGPTGTNIADLVVALRD